MNENMETFTITCTMKKRWVNDFMSLLKYMESCGRLGHSALVGFYSDGDGDFRPEFKTNIEWTKQNGYTPEAINKEYAPKIPERIFDAG